MELRRDGQRRLRRGPGLRDRGRRRHDHERGHGEQHVCLHAERCDERRQLHLRRHDGPTYRDPERHADGECQRCDGTIRRDGLRRLRQRECVSKHDDPLQPDEQHEPRGLHADREPDGDPCCRRQDGLLRRDEPELPAGIRQRGRDDHAAGDHADGGERKPRVQRQRADQRHGHRHGRRLPRGRRLRDAADGQRHDHERGQRK